MSIMPENILIAVLLRGIRAFREDSRYVDQLFRNLGSAEREEIRAFLRGYLFDIVVGRPRSAPNLPALVILLKSEAQGQAFLGNFLDDDLPDQMSYDGGISGALMAGVASTTSTTGQGLLVFGPHIASGGTATTLTTAANEFVPKEYQGKEYRVHLVAGTGKGQIRVVTTNAYAALTVSTPWHVTPDATTVFEVRDQPVETLGGEAGSAFDRRDTQTLYERFGSWTKPTYEIQVLTGNQAMTPVLTIIVRAILTVAFPVMEEQGMMNMSILATDLVTKADYMPDQAWVRSLNLTFDNEFSVVVDMGDLPSLMTLELRGILGQDESVLVTTNFSIGDPLPSVETT